MNCKQCNKGFSCGCQKTTAPDGSVVHKTCLTDYLNSKKLTNTSTKPEEPPVNTN
jgi:hypothetical protein